MTEPTTARKPPLDTPNPLFLRDEELSRGIELLDFAHRALLAEPDRVLGGLGLGRNHQRLIRLIGREPGITMVQLLDLVQLSKQSASRLVKELIAKDLVVQRPDPRDRRARLLALTERGRQLDEQLTRRLRRRLAGAYRAAGAEAVAGYHRVLMGLVDERARRRLQGAPSR